MPRTAETQLPDGQPVSWRCLNGETTTGRRPGSPARSDPELTVVEIERRRFVLIAEPSIRQRTPESAGPKAC